jgi:CHAT domain-containing protein
VGGVLSVCQDGPCLTQGYSVVISWKGLVVDVLRRQNELVRAERAQAGDPAVARLKQLRAQVVLWTSTREARAYDEWKRKYDALIAEKEALERKVLASGSPVSLGSVNLQDVQRALSEREALVDIYKYDQFGATRTWEPRYAAVVTGRTSAPRFITLGSGKHVETLVEQWVAGVEAEHPDTAWAALRQAVWEPVLRALPEGTRVVRVSGEADLLRIPWHRLTQRDPDKPLDVVEVNSARSLVDARVRRRAPQGPERVMVVGALDYDAGRTPRTPGNPNQPFATLRWTKDESQNIVQMARDNGYDSVWLSSAQATRAAVLQQIKTSTYLHFATHGFVPDDSANPTTSNSREGSARTPLVESGVALSGANVRDPATLQTEGILTAEDILDTDMTRSRLVVLSACKTTLGVKASGQGILGLRSSLHAAGARKILTSLWAVDDEATQLLMSDFYRRLWVEKKPLLIAFHEAQDRLRANPRFKAPRFWAGWSIVDPD